MSPGRGPKVRRLSACTARFCSFGPASEALSFFLASNCGTAHARLRHSRNSASLPKLDRTKLDLMKTPRQSRSVDYEPSRGKKLLSGVFPGGLESDCRTRASEPQQRNGGASGRF